MKKVFKRLIAVLLSCFLVALCVGCKPEETVAPTEKEMGLVVTNGKLMQGDEVFYGAGINYFDLFTGIFNNKWDTSRIVAMSFCEPRS